MRARLGFAEACAHIVQDQDFAVKVVLHTKGGVYLGSRNTA